MFTIEFFQLFSEIFHDKIMEKIIAKWDKGELLIY